MFQTPVHTDSLRARWIQSGPAATWSWDNMGHGDIVPLSEGKYTGNSHDVQWSSSKTNGIWVSPSSSNDSVLVMRDTDTGDDYYHVRVDGSGFPSGFSDQDLNKFQLLNNETVAIQVCNELEFVSTPFTEPSSLQSDVVSSSHVPVHLWQILILSHNP